jgi:8-oxo-dGTP diphosphatase
LQEFITSSVEDHVCEGITSMEDHRVVAAILRHQDQVLLCHRSPLRQWFPDVWDFPGGHVRPDEDPEDALIRELAEELGIELEGLLGAPLLRKVDPDTGLDLTIWVSHTWRGTPTNRQPEEHDAIGWFTGDQLEELRFADPSYLSLLHELMIV